jgi:hypothetical protein
MALESATEQARELICGDIQQLRRFTPMYADAGIVARTPTPSASRSDGKKDRLIHPEEAKGRCFPGEVEGGLYHGEYRGILRGAGGALSCGRRTSLRGRGSAAMIDEISPHLRACKFDRRSVGCGLRSWLRQFLQGSSLFALDKKGERGPGARGWNLHCKCVDVITGTAASGQ